MNYTFLIALNDIPTREIVALFLASHGYNVHCVDFDDRLLAHIAKHRPNALIVGTSLNSRFHSPANTHAAFSLLLAARCVRPFLVTAVVTEHFSPEITEQVQRFGMIGPFSRPMDLVKLRIQVRDELRRVMRLKNYPKRGISDADSAAPATVRRGRPPKRAVTISVQQEAAA